jgi:ABC-type dipeptide/oligopeptide/nickel transport system ATPase component
MTNSALPILSVKDLKTYYFQDEGVVRAVDGAASMCIRAERLAS